MQWHQNRMTWIRIRASQKEKDLSRLFYRTCDSGLCDWDAFYQVLEEVLVADAPFVILGGPGLGKSSIMAKIADIYSKKAQQGLMPQ